MTGKLLDLDIKEILDNEIFLTYHYLKWIKWKKAPNIYINSFLEKGLLTLWGQILLAHILILVVIAKVQQF